MTAGPLLEAGVPIREVSKALGHSSIQTTEKYYAKWERHQQANLDMKLAEAWPK
jgi:integrase/recombinase XerD